MKQVFRIAGAVLTALLPLSAEAVTIQGVLETPEDAPVTPARTIPGYIRQRVASPSAEMAGRRPDFALFLRVEDSLPLGEPPPAPQMVIRGMGFRPSVVACAADGQVRFVNRDLSTRRVRLHEEVLEIAPGDTAEWTCQAGSAGAELERVELVGHPFARAAVFVGDVGVPALPDDAGRFRLDAVQGTYELLWIDRSGVVARRPVQVERRPVDLGAWSLGGSR
jgi:hypothetical protein